MNLDIHEDIRQAWTPTSRLYVDSDFFRASVEHALARSWQWIGTDDLVKVPNQVHPFTLLEGSLDEPLLLTRDAQDKVHCLSNVCTHRGNLVAEGSGIERFLRCRYHGRRFGLDGTFQHMPEFEGCAGFPSEADNLPKVPFGVWKNQFFAGVRPFAPLEEVLADMDARVGWMSIEEYLPEPTKTRDYMVRGNWALYVENYLEGFHIPFVHASLAEALVYDDYRTELFPYSILQVGVGQGGEDVFDLPAGHPDQGQAISAYYWWIFPNLMFNFYPWGMSVNVVRPLGPERTRVSFIGFVGDASRMRQGAGADLDRVEREDEAIVETVQIGLKSRFYDRGRYSPKRETGTHHFHRLLGRFLAD